MSSNFFKFFYFFLISLKPSNFNTFYDMMIPGLKDQNSDVCLHT